MSGASEGWAKIGQRTIAVPNHVVFRALPQETVLLNIKSGQYHGLDPVSARFFDQLAEGKTVSSVAQQMATAFDQPLEIIQRDLAAFIDQLLTFELVELTPA